MKEKKTIPNYVRRKIVRQFEYSLLPDLAEKLYIQEIEEQNKLNKPADIYDLFDRLSEKDDMYFRPTHLEPYIQILNEVCNLEKEHQICFSCPPQHFKTTTTLISLIYFCLTQSNKKHAYITYSQTRTKDVQNEFVFLLKKLGIDYYVRESKVSVASIGSKTRDNSIYFGSVDSALTGYNIVGLVVIDDIIKNREEASSESRKKRIWDFMCQELMTRKSKEFSVIVMMTRWAKDDLIGKIIEEWDWPFYRIPAICDSENDLLNRDIGEPLLPSIHSLEYLENTRKKVGEYIFEALYQGNPYVANANIFQAPTSYNSLPHDDFITAIGVDLAYSPNKKADWSAAVRIKYSRNTGKVYITDVLMKQSLYTDFIYDLNNFIKRDPGFVRMDYGSNEYYTAGLELRKRVSAIQMIRAATGKVNRAVDCSQAWNNGTILIPVNQSELMSKAIASIQLFTGEDGKKDDVVDALASAYNSIKHLIGAKHAPKVDLKEKEMKRQRKKTTGSSRRDSVGV